MVSRRRFDFGVADEKDQSRICEPPEIAILFCTLGTYYPKGNSLY